MATCALLAEDNITYLRHARDLVDRLPDDAYRRGGEALFRSGVGPHLRHCLDHYVNFVDGLAAGRIDYDARARDVAIESDRSRAIALIDGLVARLAEVSASDGDRVVAVKMDCGDDGDTDMWWTQSTIRRELQFLLSHTVHHYALIKMILRAQDIATAPDFGVAPSTLRHEAALKCAR